MKVLSLSDVERKYSGILRGVCMLGENCLIYGLIQLALIQLLQLVACLDKMEFHNTMTYIRYWEDFLQKKDFIVFFCDERSSFPCRNIQKFKTISTTDGFAFFIYFLCSKTKFWNEANRFHSLFPSEIVLPFWICVHKKYRYFISILNAKLLK